MMFQDYLVQVGNFYNPYLRKGDQYFNELVRIRPDLANKVCKNDKLNPLISDKHIPAFLGFVRENW